MARGSRGHSLGNQRSAGSAGAPLGFRVARAVLLVCIDIFMLCLLLVTALDTPQIRIRIASMVSDLVSQEIQGSLRLTHIESLGVLGVEGMFVEVEDARGNSVLKASDLRARPNLFRLLHSLVTEGPIVVELWGVSAGSIEVDLGPAPGSGESEPALASAFLPHEREPSSASGPAAIVSIERANIAHLAVTYPSGDGGIERVTLTPLEGRLLVAEDVVFSARSASLEATFPYPEAVLKGSLEARGSVGERGTFIVLDELRGDLNGVELRARGALQEDEYALSLTMEGSADAWKGTFPVPASLPDATLSVFAEGNFEGAEATARIDAGGSKVFASARTEFERERVFVTFLTTPVQLRAVTGAAPDLDVEAWGAADVSFSPFSASALVETEAFVFQGRRVPVLRFRAHVNDERALAGVTALDCECVHAVVRVDRKAEKMRMAFDLDFRADEPLLRKLSVEAPSVGIRSLRAVGRGNYDFGSEDLDVRTQGDARGLRLADPDVRVATARWRADVRGPLSHPHVDLAIDVSGARTGGLELSRVRLRSRGVPPGVVISATGQGEFRHADKRSGTVQASAGVALASLDPVTLRDGHLSLTRDQKQLTLEFDSVSLGGTKTLSHLLVTGPGTIRANAAIHPSDAIDLAVYVDSLDLAAASELGAPFLPRMSGVVTTIAEVVSVGPSRWSGHATGSLAGFAYERIELQSAHWSFASNGGDLVDGAARIELPRGGGFATVHAEELRISQLRSRPWAPWNHDDRGRIEVNTQIDVAFTEELFGSPPPIRASGQLNAKLTAKKVPGVLADVELAARGKDLSLASVEHDTAVGQPIVTLRRERAPWELERANGRVLLRVDGRKRQLAAWVTLTQRDERQLLMEAIARTGLPEALDVSLATGSWRDLPIDVVVRFPNAPISALPFQLPLSGMSGTIGGGILLHGSMGEPVVDASLDLRDFSVRSSYDSYPVSVRVDGQYRNNTLELTSIIEHENRVVVRAKAQTNDVASFTDANLKPDYRAELDVDALPLGCFPYLRDYAISGEVDAKGAVIASNAGVEGDLQVGANDLQMMDVPFRSFQTTASLSEGRYSAQAEIVQPDGDAILRLDGELSAASGGGNPLGLSHARFASSNLDISPLQLALSSILSELGGRLSGEVVLDARTGHVVSRGLLKLEDGTLQVAALGQELYDVNAKIRALPNGSLVFDEISAKALGGRIDGSATLAYDFEGVREIHAEARIPKKDPYPLVYEGLPIGLASGKVQIKGHRTEDAFDFEVTVPSFDMHLDEKLDLSVQSIESPDDVRLGSLDVSGEFVAYEARSQPETEKRGPNIRIQLGKDVWIHRGGSTFASLRGEVEVHPAGTMSGRLMLDEGQIDVVGRVFEVRRGLLTFRGESPPNPIVIAQAEWQAPSGYAVSAEFRGPIRSGTLTLSSEPALTQTQILNVLLFDDPEGSAAEGEGNPAGAIATTVASSSLGRALSDLADVQISAGVDTSEEDTARPEVAVRLSPRLSIEAQYNPEGGTTAVTRTPDRALVSLQLRLSSRWSIESTVGDHGTSILDLTWRYRY